MKYSLACVCGLGLAFCASASTPTVSAVSMTWNASSREATISYQLTGAPAIVSLEVVDGSGHAIDGSLVGGAAAGDVYRKIESDGEHTIIWCPSTGGLALPIGGVSARVTAYPVDDPPDYMVVSCALAGADSVWYYPSEDYLPGGLHSNRQYKATKIVLRKIVAKDISWQMGSGDDERALMPSFGTWSQPDNESNHVVRLDHNYYMAVFETTHGQYWCMNQGGLPPNVDNSNFLIEWNDRPVEQAYYENVRGTVHWPTVPAADSPIGRLRATTGLAFDLPSEAEWEYACRAGTGDGVWNTRDAYGLQPWWTKINKKDGTKAYAGSQYKSDTMPGRYALSGGRWLQPGTDQYWITDPQMTGTTNGTSVVGSLGCPNAWGLYDMHGNVQELCLDYYVKDITRLEGAVCTDTSGGGDKVVRGGCFESFGATYCRSASRAKVSPSSRYAYSVGFRLCCRIDAGE